MPSRTRRHSLWPRRQDTAVDRAESGAVYPVGADPNENPATTAIWIEHLHKSYRNRATGDSLAALEDVNLEIRYGEFVSVVGASGCGKSTLLRIISGLILPTSGHVRVGGTEVNGPVSGIGFVFQRSVLLPWKTALQNVLLPATLRNVKSSAATERARELLSLVGLSASEQRYPHELSGGMQQRVALARALFADSTIILMDEPFGAVDALTRERLNVDVSKIMHSAGKTSVLVTHSIGEAVFLSDRVFVMSSGPGKVAAVTEVNCPQPRSLSAMTDSNIVATMADIRRTLVGAG